MTATVTLYTVLMLFISLSFSIVYFILIKFAHNQGHCNSEQLGQLHAQTCNLTTSADGLATPVQ